MPHEVCQGRSRIQQTWFHKQLMKIQKGILAPFHLLPLNMAQRWCPPTFLTPHVPPMPIPLLVPLPRSASAHTSINLCVRQPDSGRPEGEIRQALNQTHWAEVGSRGRAEVHSREKKKRLSVHCSREKQNQEGHSEARGAHSAKAIKSCRNTEMSLISSFTGMQLVDRYFTVFSELHN